MDDSKVRWAGGHGYTGAVVEHLRLPGARVSRIMHPPGQRIAPHGHDWPVLTIHRLGNYSELGEEGGHIAFDGPSVVFHPTGAAHADEVGEHGLETLSMTFDPAWLTTDARAVLPRRSAWRPGGTIAAAARVLARTWLDLDAECIRAETSAFLVAAFAGDLPEPPAPAWAARVAAVVEADAAQTARLAHALSLHPAWLARAYRAWRGEGLAETVRRRRVERATIRLRGGNAALAEIAAECGFCDQSHMNRAFRAVLGRTPLEVRREAALLAPLMRSA